MKSFFTKLGGFLLCAVMLTTVGCHDYAEDIRDLDNKVTADLETVKGDLESKLDEAVAGLNDKLAELYATKEMLNKVETDLNVLIADNATAITKNAGDIVKNGDNIKANADAIAAIRENGAKFQEDLDKTIAALQQADKDNADDVAAAVQLAASDLKVAIEKVNQSINDLQDGKVDVAVFTKAVEDLNKSIDEVKDGLKAANKAIDENTANITKIFGQIAELSGKVDTNTKDIATIKGQIETINGQIETIKTDVQDLKDSKADKSVVEAVEARVAALEAARTALEKRCTNLENNKADKTVVEALSASVDALAGRVDALENGLKAANKAIDENTANIKDIQATLTTLATKEELAGAVEALNGAIATAKSQLQIALAALETSTSKNLADAKDELKAAYEAADKAIADRVSAIEASYASKTDLESAKTALSEAYAKADEALKTTLQGEISAVNTTLTNEIARLKGLIEGLRTDVDELLDRIGSIVYVPEYVDGAARISYAYLADMRLDGDTELTYDVHPADDVDKLVAAVNAQQCLEYVVTSSALKSTPVEDENGPKLVVREVKAGDKTGQIKVVVRPENFPNEFYGGNVYYAASLVLKNREGSKQSYATKYTNIVAESAESATYNVEVILDDEYEDIYAEANKVEFNHIGKSFKFFEGFVPVFKSGTETLNLADFSKKFTLPDTFVFDNTNVPVATGDGAELFNVVKENATATVSLDAEKVNIDNVSKSITLTKTYEFAGIELPVTATVDIVDFTYDLVAAGTHADYAIAYHKASFNEVLLADYSFGFVPKSDVEATPLTVVEITDLGYKVNVTSEVHKVYSYKNEAYANENVFAVTPEMPVSVSLAKDENGVLVSTAGNVGDMITIHYHFTENVSGVYAYTANSTVTLTKTIYNFVFDAVNATWTYSQDAWEDSMNEPSCTRSFEYVANNGVYAGVTASENLPADQNIYTTVADVESLASITVKNGENEVVYENGENSPVSFLAVDGKVVVKYNALAWGQTYEVVALYSRASADVTVTATISTVDRPRTEAIVIDLARKSDTFKLDYVLERTEETTVSIAEALQTELDKYLGVNDDAVKELKSILGNKGTVATNFKVMAGEDVLYNDATPATTGLSFAKDFQSVSYGYNLADLRLADIYKSYDYVAEFVTWYGQKVVVKSGFDFVDPKYDYVHVMNYTGKDKNDNYYSSVRPIYKNGANDILESVADQYAIDFFGVNDVDLNKAFIVVDENGKEVIGETGYNEELGLYNSFSLKQKYDGVKINGKNILSYGSSIPSVDVTAELIIENTDGSRYAIPGTKFAEGGIYSTYYVEKFNPIAEFKYTKENETLDIIDEKVYTYDVISNITMVDKRGKDLISNNQFVEGNNDNGFAQGWTTQGVYQISDPVYDWKIVGDAAGQVIKGIDFQNGVLKVDNTGQVKFTYTVELEVSVTMSQPQMGEKTVTYKITLRNPKFQQN